MNVVDSINNEMVNVYDSPVANIAHSSTQKLETLLAPRNDENIFDENRLEKIQERKLLSDVQCEELLLLIRHSVLSNITLVHTNILEAETKENGWITINYDERAVYRLTDNQKINDYNGYLSRSFAQKQ